MTLREQEKKIPEIAETIGMESCTLLGQLGYLALVALFPMCSRSLEGSDLSGGSLGLLRDRAVTFTCSFYITSMSLDTQAFHPQASQTKARLPDSLPPCHTGSWLWITYLAVLPSLPFPLLSVTLRQKAWG